MSFLSFVFSKARCHFQGGRECAPADLEEIGSCPNPCTEEREETLGLSLSDTDTMSEYLYEYLVLYI